MDINTSNQQQVLVEQVTLSTNQNELLKDYEKQRETYEMEKRITIEDLRDFNEYQKLCTQREREEYEKKSISIGCLRTIVKEIFFDEIKQLTLTNLISLTNQQTLKKDEEKKETKLIKRKGRPPKKQVEEKKEQVEKKVEEKDEEEEIEQENEKEENEEEEKEEQQENLVKRKGRPPKNSIKVITTKEVEKQTLQDRIKKQNETKKQTKDAKKTIQQRIVTKKTNLQTKVKMVV